jgi:type IV pilus assembly protein PilM
MASGKSVWGVEIGQCALKALKLREINGQVQAEAFDIIEHPKILSQPEADRNQLILNALEQFQTRNNVSGSSLVVSVPGQSSFTRFIKLPPVDPKRIPEIVKFEAEQQIPFPINDVVWRWQTFQKEDSPDIELGIFAMKKVDVSDALEHFSQVQLDVDVVQMAPLALCNFMFYDDQLAGDGATLLADVGVDKTDLVVVDGSRIWMRTVQLGGSSFTEALVRAFKLPFNKAEKLKRSAASSKYARQIFQAMRPVFADLVQEIQRSIGFYTQLHRETRFKKLIGLGNGFRLPGLQKFLEQNLNMPVSRVDSFNNLSTSEAINAPAFTENVLSFAVAYGLAIQGMGQAAVNTNLLPSEIIRKRLWAGKRFWFTAAAACLVAASGLWAYGKSQEADKWQEAASEPGVARAESAQREIRNVNREANLLQLSDEEEKAQKSIKFHAYKNTIPQVTAFYSRLFNAASEERQLSHQALYNRIFETGQKMLLLDPESQAYEDLAARRRSLTQRLKEIPRNKRRVVLLQQIDTDYIPDVNKVEPRDLETFVNQIIRGQSGEARLFDPERDSDRDRDREGEVQFDDEGRPIEGPATEKLEPKKGLVLVTVGRSPASQPLLSDMLREIERRSPQIADASDFSAIEVHQFFSKIDISGELRLRILGRSDRRSDRRDEGDIFRDRPPSDRSDMSSQVPWLEIPDPAFPPDPLEGGEEAKDDLFFVCAWVLSVENDGVDIESSPSGPDEAVARR